MGVVASGPPVVGVLVGWVFHVNTGVEVNPWAALVSLTWKLNRKALVAPLEAADHPV